VALLVHSGDLIPQRPAADPRIAVRTHKSGLAQCVRRLRQECPHKQRIEFEFKLDFPESKCLPRQKQTNFDHGRDARTRATSGANLSERMSTAASVCKPHSNARRHVAAGLVARPMCVVVSG